MVDAVGPVEDYHNSINSSEERTVHVPLFGLDVDLSEKVTIPLLGFTM